MARQKVLFVGWDAADWKVIHPLMDAGRMPNLQRLVERGVMGRAATLHPPLSPMLWTSIATGKRPFKHGIHGFAEPTPDGRGVRPISNLSRTAKAVWNIANQNGLRSIVIGWWPSHPAEPIDGVMVSDHFHKAHRSIKDGQPWPLLANSVWPPRLHDTLAGLRIHPEELVWPMVTPFVPELEKIDQKADRRISMLAKTITECVNIHSAATWLMDNEDWDLFAVYYDAIDHFSHGFMRYHPPRQAWVGEEDFALYSNVVATAYELHDKMLGTLLAKADAEEGGQTRVMLLSDHGFHPDHLRPHAIPDMPAGPAIEHSPFGIFAMAGPGIKRDQSVFGVSVLDAAPTLLTLLGLPVGEDMDGKVIASAFESPPALAKIPSWEDVPGADGRHPPHARVDGVAAAEALEQLVALGYIEKPGADMSEYVERTVRELRYNLVESYQDANRHPEALEIARDLRARDPDEQRYTLKLFHSCQALGLVGEMRAIVDDMVGRRRALFEEAVGKMQGFRELTKQRLEEKGETDPETIERELAYELVPHAEPDAPRPWLLTPDERRDMIHWRNLRRYQPALVIYLEAQTLAAEKRWAEARQALDRIPARQLARPGLLLLSADLYMRLGRLIDAEKTWAAALAIDPDNIQAHLGLCRLALRRRDFPAALHRADECVARLYFFPMAHFFRGIARASTGDPAGAADAFRTALSQNPHFPQAHLWLARLLRRQLGDPDAAALHISYWQAMRRHRVAQAAASPAMPATPTPVRPAERQEVAVQPLPPLGDGIFVVSGLPRSGTSMLMQMLEAGGLTILTDRERQADADNPRGYLEFEAAKRLHQDQSWLGDARGKAVKIVAPLVARVPEGFTYRVLLIERDLDEILASQATMIARRGEAVRDTAERRARLAREYTRIVGATKQALAGRDDVALLTLHYDDVVSDPAAAATAINLFAGGGLDIGAMTAAIDPALHRNRTMPHAAD